jgi:hypothetical protein
MLPYVLCAFYSSVEPIVLVEMLLLVEDSEIGI